VDPDVVERQLVAAPWWPAAMREHGTGMIVRVAPFGLHGAVVRIWTVEDASAAVVEGIKGGFHGGAELARCIPDLSRPATIGCLIAMIGPALRGVHRRSATGFPYEVEVEDQLGRACGHMGTSLGVTVAGALLSAQEALADP
jgi:hypothetical protein